MSQLDRCPSCDIDLKYGDKRQWSRVVGVELPGVYDGVLYWACWVCGFAWQRWPEGHSLHVRARPYIDKINV